MSEEILERLGRVELFKDLHPRHLKRIVKLVQLRDVEPNQELVHEGSYAGDLFLIFTGSAEVAVRGKKRTTLGPGEFFGELSLLHRSPSATVTSIDRMELGVIDAQEFVHVLETESTVALHMVQMLILRLENLTVRPVGQLL